MKIIKSIFRISKLSFVTSVIAVLFLVNAMPAKKVYSETVTKNGFNLSNSIIDTDKILHGGPPRDGIPSIDNPEFITADKVDYLNNDDMVLGVTIDDKVKAYPLKILIWHEIVNDTIGDTPVLVTYCPLCGTAMVFKREINDKTLSFGVSGLLYNSDVLMYDRESESLWSQLEMKAVSGSAVGTDLSWIPSRQMKWKAWLGKYPDSKVLSTDTGFNKNYESQAYSSYFTSEDTMFPVQYDRKDLGKKEWVLGVIINGIAKAYPLKDLAGVKVLEDSFSGEKITISYNPESRLAKVTDTEGYEIPSVISFWFAWQAFYPDTSLWRKK